MTDWLEQDQRYLIPTYNRLPIAIQGAKGNYLYDTEGKAYLDLFTGLAVNILGHAHPAVIKALNDQGKRFLHISNKFLNPPAIRLARRLVENSIPGKVFFCNSGTEATEAAVKLVHKWTQAEGKGRSGFVVIRKSFHGRTLGALRLTRQPGIYQDFPQPDFPVYEVNPNDLEELKQVCQAKKPAAILVEPILGAGGIQPLAMEYLRGIESICQEEGILCCMDEIQTGIGRTGHFFAYQHASIQPDLILFAKGVGGGLPLGGVIAGEKTAHLFQPGDHGTTFAPSPLSAALGNAVVEELLDRDGLEQGRRQAAYLWQGLKQLAQQYPKIVTEIRGRGMMVGLSLHQRPKEVLLLQQSLLEQGILVDITQQTVIRLLPPLTLKSEETDRLMEQLRLHFDQWLSS